MTEKHTSGSANIVADTGKGSKMEYRSKEFIKGVRRQVLADPRFYDMGSAKLVADLYQMHLTVIHKWKRELIAADPDLGVLSDRALGEKFGVSQNSVERVRVKEKIPPCNREESRQLEERGKLLKIAAGWK